MLNCVYEDDECYKNIDKQCEKCDCKKTQNKNTFPFLFSAILFFELVSILK